MCMQAHFLSLRESCENRVFFSSLSGYLAGMGVDSWYERAFFYFLLMLQLIHQHVVFLFIDCFFEESLVNSIGMSGQLFFLSLLHLGRFRGALMGILRWRTKLRWGYRTIRYGLLLFILRISWIKNRILTISTDISLLLFLCLLTQKHLVRVYCLPSIFLEIRVTKFFIICTKMLIRLHLRSNCFPEFFYFFHVTLMEYRYLS